MKKTLSKLSDSLRLIAGILIAVICLLSQCAPAAQVIQLLPFYDSFDYNPGSAGLAGASSTVWETCYATGNIQVTNGTLTLAGFVSSAGNSVVGEGSATRFAGTQFTSQTNTDGNAVYVSFLFRATAYPTTSPGVIAFLDSTNIGTSSGSQTMPPHAGLAVLMDHTGHIGINSGSTGGTGALFESSATPTNTTVLIVARYTFHPASQDIVDLWVNPASANYGAATAPPSDEEVINTYNLGYIANFTVSYRNGDSTFGERWDEVRIGTSWAQAAPSSNLPGPASAAHSLMNSANPTSIVANGSSTSVVQMQARDINGVNLTTGGATVTFATSAGAISSTTDNGNGTYQATLTSSTNVGTATVTAKLGGTAIATIGTATNSTSLAVSFVLGPVSATASTAVANPTTVAADGITASTVTVTAMDAYNHPLAGQTVTLAVSGSSNTVSTPGSTGANGQTTATIKSTVAETKTITVTIGSTQIIAQPTVTFTDLGVSAANSTAVANPNSGLVANGVSTSTITVTAISGGGSPLSGQTVTLSVSGSGNTVTQPAPTDVNGQTTATLQSTVAGTKTIMVNIAGTVINSEPTVTFVAGPATQIAFSSQPVTTAVNVTMPSVVVQIEDQTGNPVAQSGATVTLQLSAGTLSGTNPQLTDATGKATFNDLSIPTISSNLYLTANVSGFSPVQSSVFNVPPQVFYKLNNTNALNLAASWTATEGGAGPAGPPATDGVGAWDTSFTLSTVDIGASATWYGMVLDASNAFTITDTAGGHTLTLGAGSLNGPSAMHSVTINNNIALGGDQTWVWSSNTCTLTIASNLDNGGHQLTVNGPKGSGGSQKFNGAITGSGGLTLTGSASVTLSGTNTYAGNTTVSAGKLVINTNGSIANSPAIALFSTTTLDISAASPFAILGSQTLSGDTSGTGTATIEASTANGPGTLVLAPNAQAVFTAVGNASSNSVTAGVLKVEGGATLNGNAITVNVTGASLPPGSYTLMIATNGFTANGIFPTPTITGLGLAAGFVPQIVINGEDLQLQVALPPFFSASPSGITNNCGDSATFTATAANGVMTYQWYDPSLDAIAGASNAILVLNNTHPANSGAYTIIETGPNWILTNSVVLLTTDTNPPLIALNGANPLYVGLGSNYTELGATAYDTCGGNSLAVNITGTVNTSVAGQYNVTYSAVTGAGTPGSLARAVVVIDPPLTNLVVTPSSVTPQCGSNVTFTASVTGLPPVTYQWYDNQTNAIAGATNASYTLMTPTDASVGSYTVVAQNAYNALTNFAVVSSVLHTAPPIMALNGANPVTVLLNNPYVDAGATAFDLCGQTNLTVTSNNPVNTSVAGTYTVTYSATTADGTTGTLNRTVYVINFGPNVLIFDPTMTNIESQVDAVFAVQDYNQFGPQRYALLFKQGQYSNLDIPMGYYTEVLGLGQSPDDVVISGYVHSDGVLTNENATQNFWRSMENLAVVPTNSANYMMWAVSQGTALRRMHIEGTLDLANFTDGNYASGGFLADSQVDATVSSISQQQWLSRNDNWGNWSGGVWNMVFVGVPNAPAGTWPAGTWPAEKYTVITNTPLIREKPYLYLDTNGNYAVWVPALETNSSGTTWASGPTPGVSIPISQFYIALAGVDNAASINAALNSGLNLILTPGVYQLTDSIQVTRPDTIVLGLGYPDLIPQTAAPALVVSDVDGVKVGGLLFDAGPVQTTTLMQVGTATSCTNHSADPIFLYDIFMRVGGAAAGTTLSCVQINANDVVGDNLWLWRADHGNPGAYGWTVNPCNNGLIVNGDRVTMYGLFVEHEQQYQTLWNGNWGRTYFYQSEFPYDPPSQDAWSNNGEDGYPSYKVSDQVTSHQAYGLGIYGVFIDSTNISCFDAIETPTNSQQVDMHDMIVVYITGDTNAGGTSAVDHIINGTGATVAGPGSGYEGTATANTLWPEPTYDITACWNRSNPSITFPTESWHSYQLQYKNHVQDPGWLNLGGPINGNDALQTLTDSTWATNRFYQILSH